MKRNIVRGLGLLSFVWLFGTSLYAQVLSPAGLEMLKQQKFWLHSQNAAGTVFDDTRNYSNVNIGYGIEEGDFHRPQEGENIKSLNVGSEGFLSLKDVYVWGKFSFEQKNVNNAGYNASITDPFRGMPYYVVDLHKSKWRNQYYDLEFRVGTPIYWSKIAFGLQGAYTASIATKQRDPRVDTRFYTLDLIPSITYSIAEKHKLGLTFEYASIKEDSRMSNANNYVDQDYYELYGLGVAVRGIGSGRTTNYFGHKLGAGLQYNYITSRVNLLFEGTYTAKVENVEVSFDDPKKDASVKDQSIQANVSIYNKGNRYSHYFKTGYYFNHIDGIQYVSQRDNSESQKGWMDLFKSIRSTYRLHVVSANYSLYKNMGEEYSWKLDASMMYKKYQDEYLLPNSTKRAENLYFGLCGKKNVALSDLMNNRLLLSISAGYNKSLSGGYYYGGSHADYITVTQIEKLDNNYLTSNYYQIGANITYSQKYRTDKKANIFAKAGYDYVKTNDYNFDHRSHLTFSIGANF
ncbi:hypothetical protein QYZ87_01540 [Porphyromonadaceae bacterium W3.11]|nr:hypothetical protein [Porphyromonadaceae bacterium W3.11]